MGGSRSVQCIAWDVASILMFWEVLAEVQLKATFEADPLKLQAHITEGAENLSQGQRQLLSLARAMVRRCRIVVMDEATASVDFETDERIQKTLREAPSLQGSTKFIIAHRIQTVIDSDLVVVLDAGRVVETGKPQTLLADSSSMFAAIAKGASGQPQHTLATSCMQAVPMSMDNRVSRSCNHRCVC